MSDSDDEAYSAVFASLKHPIRRKILRILSAGPESFSDLQKSFNIESSHLTYHLEGLGDLLLKTADGKYALSSLGEAAVSTMNRVEEPPRAPLQTRFPSKGWKFLVVALLVGVVLLSAFSYLEHQTLTQLSNQYTSVKDEHDLLQRILSESRAFAVQNAFLTDEYVVNGTAETMLGERETSNSGMNLTSVLFSYRSFKVYPVYTLINNSTLEIEVSFANHGHLQTYLSVAVCREVAANESEVYVITCTDSSSCNKSEPIASQAYSYGPIWEKKVASCIKYTVSLPSKGWYFIHIEAPILWNETEPYAIDYTLSLHSKNEGNYAPFFVGRLDEGYSSFSYLGLDPSDP